MGGRKAALETLESPAGAEPRRRAQGPLGQAKTQRADSKRGVMKQKHNITFCGGALYGSRLEMFCRRLSSSFVHNGDDADRLWGRLGRLLPDDSSGRSAAGRIAQAQHELR